MPQQFEKRAECVSDQYAQYVVVDDIHINGKLTEGEDMADLGGKRAGLPGVEAGHKNRTCKPIDGFTPEQRYFVGIAQWACGNERPEDLADERHHRSAFARQVSRQRRGLQHAGVSEGFPCKAGQPMVREHMCKVW